MSLLPLLGLLGASSFQTCQPVDRSVGRSVLVSALGFNPGSKEVVITFASMSVPSFFAPNYFAISVATIIFPIWLSCLYLNFSSQSSGAGGKKKRRGRWMGGFGIQNRSTFSIPEYETVRNWGSLYWREKQRSAGWSKLPKVTACQSKRDKYHSGWSRLMVFALSTLPGTLNHMLLRYIRSSLEVKNFQTFQPFIPLAFLCLGPSYCPFSWGPAPTCWRSLILHHHRSSVLEALLPSERVRGRVLFNLKDALPLRSLKDRLDFVVID